ncbi:MAG: D-alanyl-D-alanine carboxypeptidase [Clostridia bacterium]|nr:D-alanyl-D-alanine carboxypeptidase [Clostridia bacterium]
MKKYSVFFIFLAFIITIGCFTGINSKRSANAYYKNDEIKSEKIIDSKCKSAFVMDAMTNTPIFSNNEMEKRPIASMCKIMTLILCFEEIDNGNLSLDDNICVSDNAAGMGGSQVFLESNAGYPANELIKSIVVASANDSCVAMAEKICGSEDVFVEKMNEKAKELGMDNTCFVNCTGLPKAGQYSCAKDVATMFSKLLTFKDYYKFSKIWMDKISHPNDRVTEISNTNKLIRFYKGCDGGKTGYTSEAGHCLAASAFRDGTRLVAVVIGAPDSKTRFSEVSSMFNYGFANYTTKKIVDDSRPLKLSVNVEKGKQDYVQVKAEKSLFSFCKKNEKRAFEFTFEPLDKIKAPICKGDYVGKLIVFENGVEIDCVNVLADEDVQAKTYFDTLSDIADNWSLIG